MKKAAFLGVVTFLAVAFTTLPLFAQINIEGKGVLRAKGHGLAVLEGTGEIEIAGNGFLLVNENADVVILEGSGEKVELEDGRTIYLGFQGRVHIYGESIEVEFGGANIRLGARGEGRVVLMGAGVYKIGRDVGAWDPDEGTEIIIGDNLQEE